MSRHSWENWGPWKWITAVSRIQPRLLSLLIRWPINRFNRFCDFLRFNRFNRFIEIIKSIFSKFWKLTNFRFFKKFQFSEFFCYELNFVNCWLETTHWKRLGSNSVHNEEMVPEQTTRRRCRTLHHLSDPAPPCFSWIYWAFFLMGPLSITCGTTNHSKREHVLWCFK